MITKSTILLILILVLVFSPSLACAGDEAQINAQLQKGGTVTLEPKTYTIDGPIYIGSNTVLTGSTGTIIQVSSSSSQWFTGSTGIITANEPVNNVLISNIHIDGNCENLPASYNSNNHDPHDCESAILIRGYYNQFCNNLTVQNVVTYDTFCDGVHVWFANDVHVLNCTCSDDQHEGVYFCEVHQGEISGCDIAGITSDCARVENSINVLIDHNIFYSYSGNHNNGAYKHGENGLQLGDQGRSFGVGSPKQDHEHDIEVFDNTFANNGLEAILADPTALESSNVYIHNNSFIGKAQLETLGIPVNDNFSYSNPPTISESEQIFSSIFDILDKQFSDSGRTDQAAENIPFSVQETEQGAIMGGIKIIGFKDLININGVPYIPDENSTIVKYGAVKAPSFNFWDIGVSNISETVNTKIENGTAYAKLTVLLEYYTISYNHKIGRATKNYHSTEAVFTDSCQAPEVLERPRNTTGQIIFYNNSYNPHSLVYVPPTDFIKIVYEYSGNTSEHIFMIGERDTNENGVQYTNFSTCDYWRGDIPYQGAALYIPGSVDQDKLNVTCYTPYESFQVTKYERIEKAWKGESFSDWVLPFVLKLGIILFFMWRLLKIPFS